MIIRYTVAGGNIQQDLSQPIISKRTHENSSSPSDELHILSDDSDDCTADDNAVECMVCL